MDLLSEADKFAINEAFGDLKDTFHKDLCAYIKVNNAFTLMDHSDNTNDASINLDCRITYTDGSESRVKKEIDGTVDKHWVEIRFFASYLKGLGFMSGNNPNFEVDSDKFKIGNDNYMLRMITYDDSDFGGDVVLVVCHCQKLINAA